jgi:hypothetical protein
MNSIKCRVCNNDSTFQFKTKVMTKYDVSYYLCDTCEFMQVEEPYWLDEAYASPINLSDTGIISRNLAYSVIVAVILYNFFDIKTKYLDFAGGYGIFTRLMRDIGFDFLWQDIYTKNLVARGFEYTKDMGRMEALTAFETFEHFVTPIPEMENMLKTSDSIIFSTMMRPELVPNPDEWWYYGREHGQHTALYRIKTLETIAEKFGMKLYTNEGDLHLLTKKKLLPKMINSKVLYKEILPNLDKSKQDLVKKAYNQKWGSLGYKLGLTENARRTFYKLKIGDYYILNTDLSTVEKDAVAEILEGNYIQKCFIDTLTKSQQLFNLVVKKDLQSKTFDDMLYMKQFMHQD